MADLQYLTAKSFSNVGKAVIQLFSTEGQWIGKGPCIKNLILSISFEMVALEYVILKNFPCSQWHEFNPNDDIYISMTLIQTYNQVQHNDWSQCLYIYPMLRADSRFWLVNNREIWSRISRLTSSAWDIKTKERHWWRHNGDSDRRPLSLPLWYDLVTVCLYGDLGQINVMAGILKLRKRFRMS